MTLWSEITAAFLNTQPRHTYDNLIVRRKAQPNGSPTVVFADKLVLYEIEKDQWSDQYFDGDRPLNSLRALSAHGVEVRSALPREIYEAVVGTKRVYGTRDFYRPRPRYSS